MHLPDGFISLPVAISSGLISSGVLWVSVKKSSAKHGSNHASLLGLTTAFIFSAQMINFPIFSGTSGHLLGAGLAGTLLGNPWSAILSLSTVLIIQAILFADGGITALGANILTMGIFSVGIAWTISRTLLGLLGGNKKYIPVVSGLGAGIGVLGASLVCGILLALSETSSAELVIPSMAGIHLFIGVSEGIITTGILSYILKVRPNFLQGEKEKDKDYLYPVIVILLLCGIVSLFSSAFPDGLEFVARNLGFIELAKEQRIDFQTPFSDYEIPSLGPIGKSSAGLLGALVCFTLAYGIVKGSSRVE